MGLIVPENTFLEVGPIGFYSDSDIADIAGRLKGFFEVFQKCSPDAPPSMTS